MTAATLAALLLAAYAGRLRWLLAQARRQRTLARQQLAQQHARADHLEQVIWVAALDTQLDSAARQWPTNPPYPGRTS